MVVWGQQRRALGKFLYHRKRTIKIPTNAHKYVEISLYVYWTATCFGHGCKIQRSLSCYTYGFVPILLQFHFTLFTVGTAVAQWLRCCATNRNVAGSNPAGVIGIFHWHKILLIALWPWGRLSLYQKWVPGVFPGGKGGRCVRLTTLPTSCAVVTKSGNLNFLEPSGPVQACSGTALFLLYLTFVFYVLEDGHMVSQKM